MTKIKNSSGKGNKQIEWLRSHFKTGKLIRRLSDSKIDSIEEIVESLKANNCSKSDDVLDEEEGGKK